MCISVTKQDVYNRPRSQHEARAGHHLCGGARGGGAGAVVGGVGVDLVSVEVHETPVVPALARCTEAIRSVRVRGHVAEDWVVDAAGHVRDAEAVGVEPHNADFGDSSRSGNR